MAIKHNLQDSDSSYRVAKRLGPSVLKENAVYNKNVTLTLDEVRTLLVFSQDSGEQSCNNINRLRELLRQALDHEDNSFYRTSIRAFKEYIQLTTPLQIDSENQALSNLMQAWSFASRIGRSSLFVATTALLADTLDLLSTDLEFYHFGTAVCQTLLLEDHLDLLERGLSANAARKEVQIVCLRLLRGVVCFDGGVFAKHFLRRKRVIFATLANILVKKRRHDTGKSKIIDESRHAVISFLLAILRGLDWHGKKEVLLNLKIAKTLFQNIAAFSAEDIISLLKDLRNYFLSEKHINRAAKGRMLSEAALTNVASLCNYSDHDDMENAERVRDSAHEFLLHVCTSSDCGVLSSQNGWFTPDQKPDKRSSALLPNMIPSKARVTWPTYKDRVPVENTKLAFFIQDLRPHKNSKHQELLLAIFKAAPELTADYFLRQRTIIFEPKMTVTWMGYASFLLGLTGLDPPNLDGQVLPNPSIVLENVIPSSVKRTTMNKCFTGGPLLIKLITSRVMTTCLLKLRKIFEKIPKHCALDMEKWHGTVVRGIQDRCPDVSAVLSAFRNCQDDHRQLKEALSMLLSQFYEVLPSMSLGVRYDMSIPMTNVLLAVLEGSANLHQFAELDHYLKVAISSQSGIDWFRRPMRLPYSPFTTLLRIHSKEKNGQIGNLIRLLARDCLLFQTESDLAVLESLCEILHISDSEDLLIFLDTCFLRLFQKPVRYEGDAKALGIDYHQTANLIFVVLTEQWPHLVNKSSKSNTERMEYWINAWLESAMSDQGSLVLLQNCLSKSRLKEDCAWGKKPPEMPQIQTKPNKLPGHILLSTSDFNREISSITNSIEKISEVTNELNHNLTTPSESVSYPQLFKWSRKSITDALEDNDIASLVECLSASVHSVRKQALGQLKILAETVKNSDYGRKRQLHLLLMELTETSADYIADQPLPFFTTKFASAGISIVNEPTHYMYNKINVFLLRAPEWDVKHLPTYWKDQIFTNSSTGGMEYLKEAEWLLDLLIDGLQTSTDLEIYGKQFVFEQVLLRYSEATARFRLKVVKLLWRCSFIENGSTMLVTRCGLAAWAETWKTDVHVVALLRRVYSTCDKERLESWSLGKPS